MFFKNTIMNMLTCIFRYIRLFAMHTHPYRVSYLTQKSMLSSVLQRKAVLRTSVSGSGRNTTKGIICTRGLWVREAWRWTTIAARPSKWEVVSDDPLGQIGVKKKIRYIL